MKQQMESNGQTVGQGRRALGPDSRSADVGHRHKTFVLNPAGYANPDLAIAASRAGAVGVLNAEVGNAAAWIEPALARLAQFGGPSIGLKLTQSNAGLLGLAARFGDRLAYLVVDPPLARAFGQTIADFRRAGGRVAIEISDWSAELAALGAEADALWLKGHEAGGWVGEHTSFILLQKVAGQTALPLFIRGGINCRSAAAACVGGAAGVVLDDQLLLLRESPLAAELAPKWRHFTGIETILIEQDGAGPALRIWPVPGRTEARALASAVRQAGGRISPEQAAQIGWAVDAAEAKIPPLGQDGGVASAWAASYGSVSAALRALDAAVAELPAKASSLQLCGPDTPLAKSHGTLYPIVQGPMTHVSDRVDFIEAVAAAGALPMVAVSLLRGEMLHGLLRDTRERLGARPWGVGILGFVPAEILKEQRAAVRETRPAFAIIAGGRPDQSRELEEAGIRTYLHVPSPALLTQFLEQGARHFIFEGRECGGHIGPLSSFVLWGLMTDALTSCDLPDAERRKIHVLFAGGIHDARSAAMAAVMAVPLAEHGIRSGILMGTAYTFTEEAVTSRAITPEFQRIVIEATQTVGLVTGPGHASRCVVTPFVEAYWQRSRELDQSGASPEDIRAELEDLSIGRLRLASKGVVRQRPDRPELREASVAEQRDGGMFMIGQAAVLRHQATTIADLHRAVAADAEAYLRAAARLAEPAVARSAPPPADVAIVGMSAILPGAGDVRGYWENVLDKFCAIREIPPERWPLSLYFDADREVPDKIYSKWGGFIADVPFDPTHFGIPPVSVPAIDPTQLLALVAVEAALRDAGMTRLDAAQREVTSVILGFTGGLGELGLQYGTRSELARALGDASAETLAFLPQWTSDSFAGLLPNVTAGRVANRFDFGGVNFVVDAACASSLSALRQGVQELESGRSDLIVCGGVEAGQGPFGFVCFSKIQALSPTGQCRTFDAAADGTALSDGIAMVVLKRLADAERDGDKIYAVIKGVGGSSDGRARGLMAPLPIGQKRALERAYTQAGYSPATVDLFEAHGTGTVAGDAAEIQSLSEFLNEHGARPRQCAVGSVKTMIGHTKAAAGIAGLIKVTLGLHHRVLPPHMGVEQPNQAMRQPDSPIGLHQQVRPWFACPGHARRAGVSAFGFGGANFHATLEEYQGDYRTARPALRTHWPAELCVWRAADRAGLIASATPVLSALETGAEPSLAGLAQALALSLSEGKATLAVVATSVADLRERLAGALAQLRDPATDKPFPAGVYFSDAPLAADGKLAMLFAGQGSQYPDMLRELATTFDEVRQAIEEADAILCETPTYRDRADPRLSSFIYPFDRFGAEEESTARAALSSTDVAQPALGAVEIGLLTVAARLGLHPDMVGGHSYGEYVALYAAGVLSRRDLLRVSEARGRFIIGATRNGDLGTMAAVASDAETLRGALDGCDVVLANLNAPKQTVISGARAAIKDAIERLGSKGLAATPIPVAAAFHSPLMRPAQEPLVAFFAELDWSAPRIPIYANTTAAPHETQPERIREMLGRHLTEPVKFLGMMEAMYAGGARVFLEIGPKSVLTDLTRRILGTRPHRAVSIDGSGGGLTGMLHAMAALMVEGVPLDLGRLFHGRVATPIDLAGLPTIGRGEVMGPNTWMLNTTRARRAGENIQVSVAQAPRQTAERLPPPAYGARETVLPRPNEAKHTKEFPMDGHDGPVLIEGDPDANGSAEYPPASGADRTMAEYYQTMRQFLQVQERLMMAYLTDGRQAARPFAAPRVPAASKFAIAAPPVPKMTAPAPQAVAISSAATSPAAPAKPAPAAAPAPVAAAAATTVAEPRPAVDPTALLLQVASERTGYPQDMLGLDLDMEADLGIDSIKRVEILGVFRKMLPTAKANELSARMDDLSKAKSLRSILDLVGAAQLEQEGAPRPFELAGKGQDKASAPLSRYVIRPWAEPLPADRPTMVPSGIYVVVPDSMGLAAAVSNRLEVDGARVRLMPKRALASEDALGKWLGTVRAEDRIRGIVDLRPVRQVGDAESMDLAAWRAGMENDLKALYPVLRLASGDLSADGCVLVASGMGGFFGRDALHDTRRQQLFAGSGGAVGLIKCLSLEWPGCHCKAVDLDLDEPIERLSEHLHAELAFSSERREAGYPGGTRTIFRTEPASLIPQAAPREQPDEHWVTLAIGGARGITAETLREFAARRTTCVIVGRSALPGPEDAATTGLHDAPALRSHFLARAKESGERPTPAAIEARIAALLRDRETRANLDDFTAAGARVDYRVCDVRQESEVATLLQSIYQTYGRVDAVLFGAGLIEDQLLVNKTPESLSRVFDTKVDGAFLLARQLQTKSLKFVAFFASVAGRYGNRGQTDYGAANEVLNRFAWLLQAKWGQRVKVSSINWGPWARTTNGPGMLTPETARQFRERGVNLIEPEEGRGFLIRELLYAPHDEVEVVAGEYPWEYHEAAAARGKEAASSPVTLPLLPPGAMLSGNGKGRRLRKTIDLVSDPYLDDHRIDGWPVLPFVCATEYMAEAATLLGLGHLRALTGIRMLHGISLRGDPLEVEITVQPGSDAASAMLELVLTQPKPRIAYRATAEFGEPLAPAPRQPLAQPIAPVSLDIGAVYRNWLFHGPRFQTIRELVMMSRNRIVAQVSSTRPEAFYPPARQQSWIFDPGIVDGAMQLIFAWSRHYRDAACLPTAIGRIARFDDVPLSGDFNLTVEIQSEPTDSLIRWQLQVVDSDGRTRLSVDDGEAWIDSKLNRLCGGWAGGIPAGVEA